MADDRAKLRSAPSGARLGSSFVELLKETGELETVTKAARKQVRAWRLQKARAIARQVKNG